MLLPMGQACPCGEGAVWLIECQGGTLHYHCVILEAEALSEIPLTLTHAVSLYVLAIPVMQKSTFL